MPENAGMPRAGSTQDNSRERQAGEIHPSVHQDSRFADTIAKLQAAIKRQPLESKFHFALARALLRSGHRHQAELSLTEGLRLNPAPAAAWIMLGALLERRRAFTSAARLYRNATRKFPGDAGFWIKLGRAQRRAGHVRRATSTLSEALRLAPESAEAQFELGVTLQIDGKLPQAGRLLQQALQREPANVLFRAGVAGVESALAPPPVQEGGIPATRVGLHMNQSFHYSILGPIFESIRTRHPAILAGEPALLHQFKPEILVVADAQGPRLRARFPDAKLVFVRHGLISKQHLAGAVADCDFVAGVSSDTIRDEIVRSSGIPAEHIWVTGHVPMDPLFRGQRTDPDEIPLPKGNRTVLFAPTWNRGLSGLELLGRRTIELLIGARRDINLIIKPHPATLRDKGYWISKLRSMVQGRENIWLVDDPGNDGMALLPHADVLVSDASSLIFAFLACDRPLVLITHPRRRQDPGYNENGIEWRWRDVGEEITDIDALPAAIQRALEQPDLRASRRAHYRRLLFGPYTDGRAAERIAARISSLPVPGRAQS